MWSCPYPHTDYGMCHTPGLISSYHALPFWTSILKCSSSSSIKTSVGQSSSILSTETNGTTEPLQSFQRKACSTLLLSFEMLSLHQAPASRVRWMTIPRFLACAMTSAVSSIFQHTIIQHNGSSILEVSGKTLLS